MYVLEYFVEDLKQLGLHEAVRATCFSMEVSVPNFYTILELFCLASGTFFTSVGELRLVLHKIWEVFNLLIDSLSYEEYFPCVEELEQLKKEDPTLFESYRELMCHFYICLDIHQGHGSINSLKS